MIIEFIEKEKEKIIPRPFLPFDRKFQTATSVLLKCYF